MRESKPLLTILVGVFFALIWSSLQGNFGLGELIFGFVVGSLAWQATPVPDKVGPLSKQKPMLHPGRMFKFVGYFMQTVIKANIEMTIAVVKTINGYDHLKPAIIEYPMRLRGARRVTAFANWITLTPGTLTIEVTPERDRIFIHTTHMGESKDAFIARMRKIEMRIEDLFK